MMSAALGTPAAATNGPANANAQRTALQPSGARTLVAYFTRSGNTQVIAKRISRTQRADIVEIEPATAYPEDYEATVAQAKRESDNRYQPPLAAAVPIGDYDVVFLGFPVWGETIPPVIRSFLTQHDLAGKTLLPFITHGGYGAGDSMRVVRQLAPRARILDPFVMEADQERRTITQVSAWLARDPVRDAAPAAQ